MKNRDNSLVTKRIRYARLATFASFMLIGAMMYIWSTSVSAYRHFLGFSGAQGDADFGIIALGIGIGAAAGSLLIGRFIDIFGPKKVVGFTLILYPLSIIPMGWVSAFWFSLTAGIVMGLLRGATDTAVNAHGVQVERFYKRPIMSGFHACYSLGGFLFGLVGSYLAALYPQSATVPFTIAGVFLLIAAIIITRYLLDKDEIVEEDWQNSETSSTESISEFNSKSYIIMLMVGFGVLLLGSMIGENAVGDWGQEYLHRVVGTTTAVAGMAISFFTGAQFVGRILGDHLAEKLGAGRFVFYSGICALLGLLLQIFGGSAIFAIAGYALFGFGLSCLAPLMLSSAGRKDPKNAGRNIGIVNGIGYFGMLLSPAALSLIVTNFGIEKLLYFPLVLIFLLTILAPRIMRDKRNTKKSGQLQPS